MIDRLIGELIEVADEEAVLMAGPVGYRISLSPYGARALASRCGQELTLYTVHYVQGAVGVGSLVPVLVGFERSSDRDFYVAVRQVDGLGPKAALRLMSEPPENIAAAIAHGDTTYLKKLPGIGRQKAADLVSRLQGKVDRFLASDGRTAAMAASGWEAQEQGPDGIGSDLEEEVTEILLQLGYSSRDARRLIGEALVRRPEIEGAEALVQEIFQHKRIG